MRDEQALIAENARKLDHSPLAAISATPAFLRSARGARPDRDPVPVMGEVDPVPSVSVIAACAYSFQQHEFAGRREDDRIGRVVALLRSLSLRQHPRRLLLSWYRSPPERPTKGRNRGPGQGQTREALGEAAGGAASSRRCAWSNTATANPRCASASAAVRPPMPAPAMMTLRQDSTVHDPSPDMSGDPTGQRDLGLVALHAGRGWDRGGTAWNNRARSRWRRPCRGRRG